MRCTRCSKDVPSRYYFSVPGICNDCWGKMTPDEQERNRPPLNRLMASTTFTVDGYRITKTFGVVRGITVRSRSIFGTIAGGLQTIVGGNITIFTDLCERTREEAFEMMIRHAEEVGANAVIGVRYDATEVLDGVTEVLCYGTAVVVEREA